MQTQLQSQTTPAPTSLYQIQLTPEASHGHLSVQGGGGHTSYKAEEVQQGQKVNELVFRY